MRRIQSWSLILLACCTFFSYGCTTAQRKQLMDEFKGYVENYVKEEVIPAAKEKASEIVNKKLDEQMQKQLASLDAELASFTTKDPVTGLETPVTWQSFDADKNGELDEKETAQAGKFIGVQTAKKVASGEMSAGEAAQVAKGSGVTLGAIMLILLARRGAKKYLGKKNGEAVAVATGAQPQPPQPSS